MISGNMLYTIHMIEQSPSQFEPEPVFGRVEFLASSRDSLRKDPLTDEEIMQELQKNHPEVIQRLLEYTNLIDPSQKAERTHTALQLLHAVTAQHDIEMLEQTLSDTNGDGDDAGQPL